MAAHDDGLQTVVTTVRTAGESRDVSSASFESEIPSTGPASLPAGGGMTAATGSLTLEDPGEAIEVRRGSPWFRDRGWPPALGDPVEVDVDVDGSSSRRFTGVVEDVAGSATEPVEARIVDNIDRLHRRYGSDPLADPMPVRQAWSTGWNRAATFLRHEHHVTAAMRVCGFHVIPRAATDTALHVPLTGSTLPAVGQINDSDSSSAAWQGWTTGNPWPGSLGLRGWQGLYATADPKPTAAALELRQYLARAGTGVQRITLNTYSTSIHRPVIRLELQFTTTSTLTVRLYDVNGPNAGEGYLTLRQTVAIPWDSTRPWIGLRIRNGTITLGRGTDVLWSAPYSLTAFRIDSVRVDYTTGDGVVFGPHYLTGVPSDTDEIGADLAQEHAINAHLYPSPILAGTLSASPFVPQTDALSFLRRVAAATLADMWLDRAGHLHWAGVGALVTRPVTATLTAEADLLDLAWEENTANLAHTVTVACDLPALSITASGANPSVHLWAGSGDQLDEGDVASLWASPEAGEDWLAVSWPPTRESLITSFGSRAGGSIETGSGITNAGTSILSVTWQEINSQTYKIDHAVIAPPGGKLSLRSRNASARYADHPLPVIRGHGRIKWTPSTHTGALEGPAHAADYEHEAGPWVQGADCQVLADWIAEWVTAPGPVLRELPIIYRPDLKLGDVVEVVEDAVYHVRVRAVVVGMNETHDDGSSDMTVTLRVLALSQQPATLDTYDQVWAGGTLAQRDAEWSGQTLAQFDANPLRRS